MRRIKLLGIAWLLAAANAAALPPSTLGIIAAEGGGAAKTNALIGTLEHPILNGSFIAQSAPPPLTPKSSAAAASPSVLPTALPPAALSDDQWANQTAVRQTLERAARSGKLSDVLQKSAALQLPASVALVPLIESNYRDQALSPKGAAGAWQLMPDTAKAYGVSNAARYQWQPATQAALRLLSQLHQQFGNWTLAYAAYNAGAGRVQAAVQQNPRADSLEELSLPAETKTYVQHLQQLSVWLAASTTQDVADERT